MTLKTRLSVLFVSTPVLAFVLVGGLMGKEPSGDQTFQHLRVFEDVVSLVMGNYVEQSKTMFDTMQDQMQKAFGLGKR